MCHIGPPPAENGDVALSPGRSRTVRRLAAALMVGVALTASAACGSDTPTAAAAATTPPPPPPPPPPVTWPLTGMESGSVTPRPAVAVKIENSVTARPQTGL